MQGAGCACGRRLLEEVEGLYQVIEQETFLALSYEDQQEYLRAYEQVRQAYFEHVGVVVSS